MTEPVSSTTDVEVLDKQLSLSTAAARNLATTTKSVPQMQEISSRWLLRVLPWVHTAGGVYRVNRRLTYVVGDRLVTFVSTGSEIRVVPAELTELPPLRGYDGGELTALADSFVQREYSAGDVLVSAGDAADEVFLIAHGKVGKYGPGAYDDERSLGILSDGEFFGDDVLVDADTTWDYTVRALTGTTVLALPRQRFQEIVDSSDQLRAWIDGYRARPTPAQNRQGEAEITIAAGHAGEPALPGTFVDYELSPREYELSVAQTVLRVHSRVADLYNEPMNQLEQQLRLTVEALRERQEHELVNNPDFGLLHNADLRQRIHTRSGPPTPDDLDELLSRRRSTHFLLAHPRTIAAFGRECTARGIYPATVLFHDQHVPAWRGVPLLPVSKIPVSPSGTTSILALRTGEDSQGVIGLHHVGLPDELEPGLSVRFMGISDQAIISYLVTTYYSAAVLVPDALGILENVEIGR
ncbi:cyclic nucleotide-binding domain-containing protein [Frankia sp. CNm7]|uniref:Cyclic nucleotide-binding domain-containing protein n=1 Tax=Frankia nepalensis TaxID=1836974 RepID=A0A937UTU9_9ACTN|nr:family 2B encapsulin nanocompartment shell protein [Frankia nepalensis]MBL7499739.1 cyclic nucleotide-binding domain-containing protein [Frankia nepalensis]MBL7510921.1 cyclic nucleotide-binding domain-containing protein [Frankia nepalensis]MBL7522795.1 cyclic nucleotide-binding domain-containing protein [Frankia nepalensis]MBL7630421.1 cyclic nucleotide-binding domain-containing protein [Frankia nepalensis]